MNLLDLFTPASYTPDTQFAPEPPPMLPMSPYERGAARTRRAVAPPGGRPEGLATMFLEQAGPAIARTVAGIPQRAMEASNERLAGGDYNPEPVVDLAMLMTGGLSTMPGATRAAGAAALNPARYAEDAGRAITAAPKTAAAVAGGVVAGAPAATAGDPGEEFGILKPQLPSEPQPRPALMPDESQMPEPYRANPRLRRKWYDAEVQKLAPVNAQRQAEDKALRDEWNNAVTAAQGKYSADIEAARKAKADREASSTFLERNPEYRYVPLAGSLAAGGLASLFARGARAGRAQWGRDVGAITQETRAATAAGDVDRAQALKANLAKQLETPEPSGKLAPAGYAAAAFAGPELAAVPTIVDFNTPGRPHDAAVQDMQDWTYWLKTYGAPFVTGLSAAKSGALLTKPGPSAAPAARGAIAEADTLAAQFAGREQSALVAAQAEQARLQGILDDQAAKRAAAVRKAQQTRAKKRKTAAQPSANLTEDAPEM